VYSSRHKPTCPGQAARACRLQLVRHDTLNSAMMQRVGLFCR
jgi:hypothetical protein